MANEDVSIQSLEGPWSSHLYIGFSKANKKTVFDLRLWLEKHGVICKPRATNDSIQESIREGVKNSQKCLLFLTHDYEKDDWYEMETTAVIEKSKLFPRDMVIYLESEDLEVIPDRLQGLTTHLFKLEKLNDDKCMAQLVNIITQEPYMDLKAAREKQIPGYESARNYFYGYLCLVLPGFPKQLVEETLKNDPDLVPKTVRKKLIVVPESCICPTKFKSEKIEFTDKYINRLAHRAGNQNRDYKSSLHKLVDNEEHQYYFAGEFATPLVTMYDAYKNGLCGITKDQMYEERDGFYFVLKAILSHPDNAECNDKFKLLYWSDPETGKPNQPDIYEFILPVLRKEISLQGENDRNPSKMSATNNVHLPLRSFETVPARGCNPGRAFEMVDQYPMDRSLRGLCLIVNIINFVKGGFKSRGGAEKDEKLVEKLFNDLRFEVKVLRDVNESDLLSLFSRTKATDHTNYDAFVCCIMTHGKLGVIYTNDGKPVEILKLVDYFTDKNCPSLKGKPKMFFIQACQGGDSEPETGAAGNSLPHESSTGDHLAFPISQNTDLDSLPVTEVEPEIIEDAIGDPTSSLPCEILPQTLKCEAVLVPGSPDFLMSYSTLPGSASYRDKNTGSFYIQALAICLRKGVAIDRALIMVSSSVKTKLIKEYGGVMQGSQLPFYLTTGNDKLIYF